MDVSISISLGYSESQIHFGQPQVSITAKIKSAEEITRATEGNVYWKPIKNNFGDIIGYGLDYKSSKYSSLRDWIQDKLEKVIAEKAVETKQIKVEIDAKELRDEIQKEYEKVKAEIEKREEYERREKRAREEMMQILDEIVNKSNGLISYSLYTSFTTIYVDGKRIREIAYKNYQEGLEKIRKLDIIQILAETIKKQNEEIEQLNQRIQELEEKLEPEDDYDC